MASSRPPKRTVSGFVASPIVTVLIGPPESRTALLIHKDVIVPRSLFFANALSDRWDNSKNNTIDIYKFDPKITANDFQRYLETVYTNEIAPSCDKNSAHEICRTYVVAEAMLDRHTRNLLLKALYNTTQKRSKDDVFTYPGAMSVKAIYEGTATATNPMRKLLVDMWYDQASLEWYEKDVSKHLPKEFLRDVVMRPISRWRIQEQPLRYNLTKYMELDEENKDE
ncbi:hypothetical protein FB567DRAFT_623328 [Paraphoma chrysanthemicola]|uniref:BTB domain-containing protein n=1 Tax=Paraphoma chrysanthemicola TaxID=798071 RepID=A0A8K0RHN8_9PLEO|nr:hypothetical protein FB567DRAFT_623328 [Paraphoma chrysanthemicola]